IDVRIELDFALGPFPERHLILEHLREAERLAAEIGDQRRLGMALAFQGHEYLNLADYDASLMIGERALAIGTALGDRLVKVRARSHLGTIHHIFGELARARRVLEENIAELAQDPDRTAGMFNYYGLSHVRLAHTLRELGEFAQGLGYLD